MGDVIAKRDTPLQCWARLRLENGDIIFISVARTGVKIFKMKWGGLVKQATLWESRSIVDVGERFFDGEHLRPLDAIVAKIIDCASAAALCVRVSNLPD